MAVKEGEGQVERGVKKGVVGVERVEGKISEKMGPVFVPMIIRTKSTGVQETRRYIPRSYLTRINLIK